MSEEAAGHGATPVNGADKHYSTLRRASDMLAQVKPKPDRGFRKTIDDAAALVETEWKAQRDREIAERNLLESARQKVLMVREIMILPLLNDLVADFSNERRKILPNWDIESAGDVDALHAIASTPIISDGGPSCFVIKAAVSVVEQGAALNLAVDCSCIDAQNLATGKIRQITEKTKAMPMAKFDDLGSQLWFHDQLKECARMCVLTRMRHVPRHEAEPVHETASAPPGALRSSCDAAAIDLQALTH
jgi:hypothetical protein